MAKSSTTLKEGDNLPPRGMSNKNRILEALKLESFETLTEGSTRDEAEIAFFRHVIRRAKLGEGDKDSGMLLKWLGDKGWSSMKPVLGMVEFDFDKNTEPHEQASQVLAAAARGQISPDIAQMFIASIANMLKIDEITQIKDRLEKLEQMIQEGNNG